MRHSLDVSGFSGADQGRGGHVVGLVHTVFPSDFSFRRRFSIFRRSVSAEGQKYGNPPDAGWLEAVNLRRLCAAQVPRLMESFGAVAKTAPPSGAEKTNTRRPSVTIALIMSAFHRQPSVGWVHSWP
jgi:hypothetical protein